MIAAIFRPIDKWPGTQTATSERRHSPFKATYYDTLNLLEHELKQLGAVNIVIHCQVERSQLRNDGWMKSDTRPAGPAVIVTFQAEFDDKASYSYPCDTFADWKSNLRAIALSLEALRKIDRYGVTRRGEQYQGFRALPPGAEPQQQMSREEAAAWIAGQVPGTDAKVLSSDKQYFEAMLKLASRRLHPDSGGSHENFVRLQEAAGVLTAHHSGKAANA